MEGVCITTLLIGWKVLENCAHILSCFGIMEVARKCTEFVCHHVCLFVLAGKFGLLKVVFNR